MKTVLSVVTLWIVLMSSGSAQDTVQVKAGWNILGSLGPGIDPDSLVSVPPGIITTALYGYTPGDGYVSAAILEKGKGYWVKVSADGIIVFHTNNSISELCGAKRVTHEGRQYHTVQIGNQCWLEENLNVGTMITGVTNQTDNATLEKYCYNDDPTNCLLYGGLYQWSEAMQYTMTPGTQGICPMGWHIPTYAEYQTLSSAVGGDGNALKAIGQGTGSGIGTNTSGFSALLAGWRYPNGSFGVLGGGASLWSSTMYAATIADYLGLDWGTGYVDLYVQDESYGFSVRCLED
jgi:uncharacterized protein (TIGR02145 family)